MLNAKAHARESEIIAQAGRLGAVTVATNMAGRGVDILLGGNPELLALHQVRDQGFGAIGHWLVRLDERIQRATDDGVDAAELATLEDLRARAERSAARFDDLADLRAELTRREVDPDGAGLDRGFQALTVDELRRWVIELEGVLAQGPDSRLSPEVLAWLDSAMRRRATELDQVLAQGRSGALPPDELAELEGSLRLRISELEQVVARGPMAGLTPGAVAELEVELVLARARRECFEELKGLYEPECLAEGDQVREAGGLYVVGTERHESRRIDNQLRGRSGRQGDPARAASTSPSRTTSCGCSPPG